MNIICKQCGHGNALGHIFCMECGTKLDLSNVAEEMERDQQVVNKRAIWKLAWIPPVLLLLALAGLLLWPSNPYKSREQATGQRSRIDTLITAGYRISMMPSTSVAIRPPVKEEDINAWLANNRGYLGVQWVTIELTDGAFSLRVGRKWGPHKIFSGKVKIPAIRYSYEITGKTENSRVNVTAAKFGHLPLFGPLKKPVVNEVSKLLKKLKKEHLVLKNMSDIIIEDGQLSVTLTSGK